ncbi:hypothetical protein TrVGV298_009212 [Trichoderma virens]|nr:hypothetical protein TrVGV298_009212 [Trichoderma virens]
MDSSTEVGFFRLITLSPGRWADEICCTLKPYNRFRDQFPPYKALSYVWGRWGRRNIPEILVNGNKVKVTTNLEAALKHLREQEKEITLWIDALCIDQSNIPERSSQVAQMREIYSIASEVIIFLGSEQNCTKSNPRSSESQRPLEKFGIGPTDALLARQNFDIWKTSPLKVPVQAFEVFSLLTIIAGYESSSSLLKLPKDIPEAHMAAFCEALRCTLLVPWWERIWVVQEAVKSPLDGRMGMENIVLLSQPATSKFSTFSRVSPASINSAETGKSLGGADILSLLRNFGHRKASDDRDRVYALLGLCNQGISIQPDYQLDVTEVYTAPIIQTIKSTKSLSVLYGDHSRKGRHDLSSWVPDWSANLDEDERRRAELFTLYDACGGVIPLLVESNTSDASIQEIIKNEMALFLDSLKIERDPKRLLREGLAPKLRRLNIQSTSPIMQQIKNICNSLVDYCHKDGCRDLPKYSLIARGYTGRSLIVHAIKIGRVSKITEPLYSHSDMKTAVEVLDSWATGPRAESVKKACHEGFLKVIMADVRRSPDGLLRRLKDEDTAIMKKWFNQNILRGALDGHQHQAMKSDDDQFFEVMRLTTTKRTYFSLYVSNEIHSILQRWINDQETLLARSREMLNEKATIYTIINQDYEHRNLLRKLREQCDILKNKSNEVIHTEFYDMVMRIINAFKRFLDDHIEKVNNDAMLDDEEFRNIGRNKIAEHRLFLNQQRKDIEYTAMCGHGLGPMLMKEDDEIYILPGSSLPLVLRRVRYKGKFCHQLVGDCFLRGAMDGRTASPGAPPMLASVFLYQKVID